MGLKEFFKKLKDDNKNFKTTMARINLPSFCGDINFGVKDGDFPSGSYISIADEGDKAVIYSTSIDDYFFASEDIASFEFVNGVSRKINANGKDNLTLRFVITFKDGKKAQADIMVDKADELKALLKI